MLAVNYSIQYCSVTIMNPSNPPQEPPPYRPYGTFLWTGHFNEQGERIPGEPHLRMTPISSDAEDAGGVGVGIQSSDPAGHSQFGSSPPYLGATPPSVLFSGGGSLNNGGAIHGGVHSNNWNFGAGVPSSSPLHIVRDPAAPAVLPDRTVPVPVRQNEVNGVATSSAYPSSPIPPPPTPAGATATPVTAKKKGKAAVVPSAEDAAAQSAPPAEELEETDEETGVKRTVFRVYEEERLVSEEIVGPKGGKRRETRPKQWSDISRCEVLRTILGCPKAFKEERSRWGFMENIQKMLKKKGVYNGKVLDRSVFGSKGKANNTWVEGWLPRWERESPHLIGTGRKPSGTFDKLIKQLHFLNNEREDYQAGLKRTDDERAAEEKRKDVVKDGLMSRKRKGMADSDDDSSVVDGAGAGEDARGHGHVDKAQRRSTERAKKQAERVESKHAGQIDGIVSMMEKAEQRKLKAMEQAREDAREEARRREEREDRIRAKDRAFALEQQRVAAAAAAAASGSGGARVDGIEKEVTSMKDLLLQVLAQVSK